MTVDEFLERVASEQPCEEEREVRVPSPELLREVQERGMLVTAFMSDPRQTRESRVFRYGHVLGPSLTAKQVAEWQARWPDHALPADLAALLLRINGVHLWADLDTRRSYQGLAPLAEWDLARVKMYGPAADAELLPQYIAITYHADGAAFVVLDAESGGYFLMDSCGPYDPPPVGRSVNELLDWLWSHRLPPPSRRKSASP